jgi:nitrate reductase gamma subunit
MLVLSLLIWVGAILFLGGLIAKMARFARMPMHVRWELYPVPHEKEKAGHGGSFLEDVDWWTKPIPKSKINELKAMSEEILLLKGVWESNRPLWFWTTPFHLGMYLIVALVGLLLFGGIIEKVIGTALIDGVLFWRFIHYLTALVAWVGLIASAVGTLGILQRRLFDRKLKGYTPPAAILNLFYMLAIFVVGIIARITVDPDAVLLRNAVISLLTFSTPVVPLPGIIVAELVMFAVFVAYMPFTFMSHMYMKFFTYHSVRWDDHPRRPGEPTDPRLMEYLKYPVSWSAKHIKKGKHETWADVVLDQEVD